MTRTLDMHSHVIPEPVVEFLADSGGPLGTRIEKRDGRRFVAHDQGFVYPLHDEFASPEAKLEAMDRKQIDVSLLSSPPTMFFYWTEVELGERICRLMNDEIAKCVSAEPSRLRGAGIVPLQDVDAAVVELERVVSEHGFRAVEIGTSVEGEQLADARFAPFLDAAERLGVLLLTHPYYVGSKSGLEKFYLTNLIGNPLDTTTMIANLLFGGTLERLPELKLCAVHGGGFVPYQVGRLEHGYRVRAESSAETTVAPKEQLRRLVFDTIVFDPRALEFLVRMVGAERVVLGSDAPFDMEDPDPVQSLSEATGLSAEERERIAHVNALDLLGESPQRRESGEKTKGDEA